MRVGRRARGYPFDTVLIGIEQVTGEQLDVRQRIVDNRLVEALVATSDRVAILPRFTTPVGDRLTLRPLTGVPAVRHVVAVLRPDVARRRAVGHVLDALRDAAADAERRHRAG